MLTDQPPRIMSRRDVTVHHQDVSIRAYLGRGVHSTAGPLLGEVDDILADARSGAPQWVVIRVRALLARYRALPITLVLRTADGLIVPVSRTTLRNSPRIRPGTALTARQELQLHTYWTRH